MNSHRPHRLHTGVCRLLIFFLAAVLAVIAFGPSASAATDPTTGTRVEVPAPESITAVGVAEHIRAGQHPDRAPPQLGFVEGHGVHTYYVDAGTEQLLVHNCGAKRGPKPFGVGAHNLKIKEIADSITDGRVIAGGQTRGLPEAVIDTTGGLRGTRRPDILVERADGTRYGINVGKAEVRTGLPVKRERDALDDLRKYGGLEMRFERYN